VLRRRVPLRRSTPLPRGLPPKRRVQVRKKRFRPRRGTDRSPDYLAWIRTLPCVVCLRVSGGTIVIEAAHTNALGPRGMSQKKSDFSAIPLCSAHHQHGPDSYHWLGEERFAREPALCTDIGSGFWRRLHRNSSGGALAPAIYGGGNRLGPIGASAVSMRKPETRASSSSSVISRAGAD